MNLKIRIKELEDNSTDRNLKNEINESLEIKSDRNARNETQKLYWEY